MSLCDVAEDWLEEGIGSGRFVSICVEIGTDRVDSRSREVLAACDGPGIGSTISKLRRGLVRKPLVFVLTVSWLRV